MINSKNSESKSYIITFLLILFLIIPNIYLAFRGADFEGASLIKRLLFVFISFNLIIWLLIFIRPKIFFIITLIFIVTVPVEIFIISIYHCSINSGYLYSIVNTDLTETKELFSSTFIYFIVFFFFISLYLWVVFKYIKFSFKINKKIRIIIAVIFCGVILGMWLREIRISKSIFSSNTKKEIISHGTKSFIIEFAKIFPYNYIFTTKDLINSQLIINQYRKNVSNFKFYANKKDTLSVKETYVLIMGESSRKHNYQLYNYSRNTNPYLSKQDKLIIYTDYISNGNLTFYCIPMLLTRATPTDFTVSYQEKSFLSAFKEAGFKTYWLSNSALFNSDHARISIEADRIFDLNSNATSSNNFDERLIPYLDSVMHENSQKKLIIINLMGSHFRYNYRYPEQFDIFKPGFEGAFSNDLLKPENKGKLTNIYDNSILYTDYVLHLIIEKISRENGVGLFFQ